MKFKKHKTPIICFLLALLTSANCAFGQSALTQMPFDIVIGTTTNDEIENKGNCIQKSTDNEWCEAYDMAGNFIVYSSENKVVNKIKFAAVDGNKLPRTWKELGLNLSVKDTPGTLDIDFRNIIKNNGANYIDSSRKFDDTGELLGIQFTYEIEGLSFTVMVRTIKDEAGLLGLYEVIVTEAY